MTVIRTLSLVPLAFVVALALPAGAVAEEATPEGVQGEGVQGIDPGAPAERVVPLPEGGIGEDEEITPEAADPEGELPLEELRRFVAVFDRIKRAYVEDVTDSELLDHAIQGMLNGLDPHSAYLQSEAFSDLEESTSGEFGGLGIEVGMEDGFVRVIAPIDGTPASRAGIQAGDLILKLDGESVKGMSLEEAVNKMRGKPGTTITLTLVRDGASGPLDIDVERDIIKVTSIRSRMLEPGFGYVRITQFQATSGSDFRDAIETLKNDSEGSLRGLIIDLRNNPGGVLQAAVEIADALIDEGLLVYTEGRIETSQMRFNAEPGDVSGGVPIVVLINGGSASASEIVAGALQDHKRAVIVGTESFGKGSVQTVMPLDNESAIKLTTARYYTPSGRSIQALGIEPDIIIKAAEITELNNQPYFSEADLSGHLTNGDTNEDSAPEDDEQPQTPAARDEGSEGGEGDEASRIEQDYQLQNALNLLKGLAIMHSAENANAEFEAPEAAELQ